MEKYITKNGIRYELRGEQYYPMLALGEQTDYEIGKYGKMLYREENGYYIPDVTLPAPKEIGAWGLQHASWLKRYHIARYNELLMSRTLNEYLYNINEEAQARFESLVVDLATSHGLTEELKIRDQLKWVQLATYVAKAAREIVESEVIFI